MDKNPLEEFKFVDGRGVLHNFLGFKMTAGQQVFGCNCTLKLVCVKFYEVCGKGDIFKIKKKQNSKNLVLAESRTSVGAKCPMNPSQPFPF